MKKNILRTLAKRIVQEEEIDDESNRYIVTRFNKKQLKQLLFFLKKYVREHVVTVRTSQPIDTYTSKRIANLFSGKKVMFQNDPSLGAGLLIYDNDDEIQLSIKGYIEKMVESVRTTL